MSESVNASFSMLVMSIASSAAMALGLTPDPQTGKTDPDKNMARFNIDLLVILKEKTNGQLTTEESRLLEHLISDLQLKFIQNK